MWLVKIENVKKYYFIGWPLMKILLGICVCSALTRTTRTPDWIVGNDLKVGERSSMIIVAYFWNFCMTLSGFISKGKLYKALHAHIPRRIFIKGQPITVKYDGQPPSDRKCHNCGEYGHISRECGQEKRPVWGFASSRPRPSEVRPDSTLSLSTSVFGLFDDKRPSKGGKPVADPKSSSVLSGRTSEGLGRLLAKPQTGLFSCPRLRHKR
jgi:hypothetical protein